ncbi:hypothetical protein H0V99_02895 [Candidatus Saccharibacteria bacterium]|nr:hypothetical protein [Candidatus Saccharibacteria bacterium]
MIMVKNKEPDSVYFLKLVLYLIIGAQWLRITKSGLQIPIPIGLIIGILFARTDHFQIDRKVEYAILLVAMFVGFWLPLGLEIVIR